MKNKLTNNESDLGTSTQSCTVRELSIRDNLQVQEDNNSSNNLKQI